MRISYYFMTLSYGCKPIVSNQSAMNEKEQTFFSFRFQLSILIWHILICFTSWLHTKFLYVWSFESLVEKFYINHMNGFSFVSSLNLTKIPNSKVFKKRKVYKKTVKIKRYLSTELVKTIVIFLTWYMYI